jgi:transcription initiation factor TFIIIB Brf1 subunit/transcription initiation factor TFIIB
MYKISVNEDINEKVNEINIEEEDEKIGEEIISIQTNGKFYTQIKNTNKTIKNDLEQYKIPEEIKNEANRIYTNLKINTKRGRRRKLLIFYCIFNAYKSFNKPKDPKMVAEIVGIKPNEIPKALSMCSFKMPYTNKITNKLSTPIDFIKDYLNIININSTALPKIIEFAENILKENPKLLVLYPQVVASGILYYYLIINGGQIDKKVFADAVKLSEMTISKIYNIISTSHNT